MSQRPSIKTINAIYHHHRKRGTTPKKSVYALLPNDLIMKIVQLAYTAGTLDYHTRRVRMEKIGGYGDYPLIPFINTRVGYCSLACPLRGVIEELDGVCRYLPTPAIQRQSIKFIPQTMLDIIIDGTLQSDYLYTETGGTYSDSDSDDDDY